MKPFSDFTDEMWQAATPVYHAILGHPFLRGLTDGSLPAAAFRHYVEQDALYLRDFGRGLALLAAKADDADDFLMFCEHAANTLIVERALHAGFMAGWPARPLPAAPAPQNLLYTGTLLRVAHERPFAEAVAAFLPCYWVYWEVGKELVTRGSPNALYQRWIDTYAGDAFAGVVRQMLALTNRLAAQADEVTRRAMISHFVTGCRCEYHFWDMGWRCQDWSNFNGANLSAAAMPDPGTACGVEGVATP
jgi:thiaminase (transcriptional activator TenA)